MVLEEAGGKAAPQPAATHQRPADSWGKKSCHNQKSPRCNLVIIANVTSTDRCGDRHAEEGERETERERETEQFSVQVNTVKRKDGGDR